MKNTENQYVTTLDIDRQKLKRNALSLTLSKDISIAFSAEVPYINSESMYVIFIEVLEKANKLSDTGVKKQTIEALYAIIHCLQIKNVLSRRLPKPSLTENDDNSSLLEWNFEKFRIGLSFEQDESKSFYFFVQRDDSIGFSDSQTRRINGEIKSVVSSLINFVIDNT
jgi:hypothetical protein